jgi:hypothetical protein
MGELVDLHLLRRARRIIDAFLSPESSPPIDSNGEPCAHQVDATVDWCCEWLYRRFGRVPGAVERRQIKRYVDRRVEQLHMGATAR